MQRAQDLIDQQCVLNSRHKDIQTVHTDMDIDKKFVRCARSAAYSVMELHKTIYITLQRNVGGEWLARVGGGRGWGLSARNGLLREI